MGEMRSTQEMTTGARQQLRDPLMRATEADELCGTESAYIVCGTGLPTLPLLALLPCRDGADASRRCCCCRRLLRRRLLATTLRRVDANVARQLVGPREALLASALLIWCCHPEESAFPIQTLVSATGEC